ncbi:MAG: thioredoxin domain-containing protein [Melioribacteraceae bacterium]|nr:thioredoxin domain-containing protein [Melioribacteraceae bacterium]
MASKNHLKNETSPYLLQHVYNPVDWHPWNDSILDLAEKENKLVIISIGYAACHWCHVMEHESFEDNEVAELMNEHFISIKVDREERPDIDQIYMTAAQLLTGRGGWPLNIIALPDGRPIYAGTYFPKAKWMSLLSQIVDLKKSSYNKLAEQAANLTNGVAMSEFINDVQTPGEFTTETLDEIFENIISTIDFTDGGFDRAPKFPLPIAHKFLLNYYYKTKNPRALEAVTITLNKMAGGGIYDQLGGGFARYSVDDKWFAPHFEKMLYDNGQLLSLYASAYQINKNEKYKSVIAETIDFTLRELTSEEGGFYSSLDADSEGIEGKFYVWKSDGLKKLLGNDYEIFSAFYNIKESGNWEDGTNIFYNTDTIKELAKTISLSESKISESLSRSKQILFKERSKRIRPGLDDKILTSWNALMLKGITDAYRVFNKKEYLDIALTNANFLKENVITKDFKLFRNYKNGKSTINAFLDDYSILIEAFINLYQATFDEVWLNISKSLADYVIQHFYNSENGMFFYTSDLDKKLIARKFELTDNVIASSNSVMANNLFILGKYFSEEKYINKSRRMLNNILPNVIKGGAFYANWANLFFLFTSEINEVAILGENEKIFLNEFDHHFLPNTIFAGGNKEGSIPLLKNRLVDGETNIYVCKDKVCKLPVKSVQEALKQIE